uniref:Uncharacterized protein n=1 Tax=Chromera velia CCMP2878 TaxID=1169474 RepID=A0A0G4HWW5_9ALVE|eukprot:Cvel_32857.t1-p1 / transcript=Cvel_32857.t1 / gene=Cvel_32857 / organism=Chromera_velia_CCMP2878 / gene_product=hypothetical protein / transcript_product=hypothetical protein / location=Cvel_scaffold5203:4964-5992(-) / protein_length=325 / sequence_SO=supercontig / SO=protein_coding / is_pseudo=false
MRFLGGLISSAGSLFGLKKLRNTATDVSERIGTYAAKELGDATRDSTRKVVEEFKRLSDHIILTEPEWREIAHRLEASFARAVNDADRFTDLAEYLQSKMDRYARIVLFTSMIAWGWAILAICFCIIVLPFIHHNIEELQKILIDYFLWISLPAIFALIAIPAVVFFYDRAVDFARSTAGFGFFALVLFHGSSTPLGTFLATSWGGNLIMASVFLREEDLQRREEDLKRTPRPPRRGAKRVKVFSDAKYHSGSTPVEACKCMDTAQDACDRWISEMQGKIEVEKFEVHLDCKSRGPGCWHPSTVAWITVHYFAIHYDDAYGETGQ